MEKILNSYISLNMQNEQTPQQQDFAILDMQTLAHLKQQALQEICSQIRSITNTPVHDAEEVPTEVPPRICQILDKLGVNINSSAVAIYLYEKTQAAKSALFGRERSEVIVKLASVDVSAHITTLDAKIATLTQQVAASKSAPNITTEFAGEDTLQYYNIDDSVLEEVNSHKYLIQQLTDFTKQIRTKWFLLLDHIEESMLDNDDAKYIYERFATYSAALNDKINEGRESRDYFDDLFYLLSSGGITAITQDYKLLWDELAKQLYCPNYDELREIIVDLNRGDELEPLPTKDKFTTAQLEHNSEVLNADLTKFALTDITTMAQSELSEFVSQYQTKIKKSQAISKELHNRRINHEISIINRITYMLDETRPLKSVFELYDDLFNFIMHNDLVIHKWNLINLLSEQRHTQLLADNSDSIKSQLDELCKEKEQCTKYLKYRALDDAAQMYAELMTYYTDLERAAKTEEITKVASQMLSQSLNKLSAKLGTDHHLGHQNKTPAELRHVALTFAPAPPDYTEVLAQILNNQELLKQQLAAQTSSESDSSIAQLPRFKKISSTGTSDSEDDLAVAISSSRDTPAPPVNSPVREVEPIHLQIDTISTEFKTEANPTEVETALAVDITAAAISANIDSVELDDKADLPAPVAGIAEAAESYNTPEYITQSVTNLAYFCRACNKQFKFSSTKPLAHCKTTTHNKKFLQWVNKNKLILQ